MILETTLAILKFMMFAFLLYIIYTRAILMYYKRWYYERQGIPYAKGMVPVFGHLLRYDKVMKKYNDY